VVAQIAVDREQRAAALLIEIGQPQHATFERRSQFFRNL
jgi:hypothetical protein